MKFPPMAIASILHRLSGITIFVALPFMLYLLGQSLTSSAGYANALSWLDNPIVKLATWLVLAALAYHLFAGTRHMIMDLGFGESLEVAKKSAVAVIIAAVIASLLLGVWIW